MIFKTQIPPHLSIEKVWENAAPTAAMAAQTISIPNIGDYSAIALVFRFSATVALYSCQTLINPLYVDSVVPVSSNAWNGTVTDSSNVAPLRICRYSSTICGSRNIRWFKDGIILDTGYWNSTTNANAIIITEIYGIKFPEQSIDETMMSSSSLDILKNSLYNYTGTSSLTTDADGNFELTLLTSGTLRMHPAFENVGSDESRYDIMLLGGGGGGAGGSYTSGNAGGGGGGGAGYIECYYNVKLPMGYDIIASIGAGGAGGNYGNNGVAGGNTEIAINVVEGQESYTCEYLDWRGSLLTTTPTTLDLADILSARGGSEGKTSAGYGGAGFSGGGKGLDTNTSDSNVSGRRGQDAATIDNLTYGGLGYESMGNKSAIETGWIGTAWHEYVDWLGESTFLAGGGGGAPNHGGCSGSSWVDTGFGASTAGEAAADNTGCGGGGGAYGAYAGGAGGSGVIIIRNHRDFQPYTTFSMLYTTNSADGEIITPYRYDDKYIYYRHTGTTVPYTWSVIADCVIDLFGVGGGGAGRTSTRTSSSSYHAGGGAGGGRVTNIYDIALSSGDEISCTVGAGGVVNTGTTAGTAGDPSSVSINNTQVLYAGGGSPGLASSGGAGGSGGGARGNSSTKGGNGGSNGSDGKAGTNGSAGKGSGISTYMFGDKTIDGIAYGAGGGGGSEKSTASGGATGGGAGGATGRAGGAGTDGTGGGGGGGGASSSSRIAGGKGGTGCVVIRLHRK